MMLEVRFKDEDGNVTFDGSLTKREVGYLLQYGINGLMAQGVMFNLEREAEDEEANRFETPENLLND